MSVQSQLPPGPWAYCPDKYDDWGCVRDANGQSVANTCPPGVAQPFSDAHPTFDDVRWAGPPQARAVAELLIRAEREADATPADEAWLLSVGFAVDYGDLSIESQEIESEHNGLVFGKRERRLCVVHRRGAHSSVIRTAKTSPTRGQIRTLCRALGITLKEQP